jgi:formiminotetrahydrofolate cyclodeaminase
VRESDPVGQNQYPEESLRSFLLKLAQDAPEPAGGSALALAGASAAALLALTCRAGARSAPSDVRERLTDRAARAQRLSEDLLESVQADAEAYRGVTLALSALLEAGAGEHDETASRDRALRAATEVPLETATAGVEVLTLISETADLVRGPVVGDLVAAGHLAHAAVMGSLRNAHINAVSASDEDYADEVLVRIEGLRHRAELTAASLSTSLAARGLAG